MNFWACINHLVPNPDCDTRGNEITEWRDARQQPTLEECEAVWPTVQAKMLVPQSITPEQLRVWLITNGIDLASVDAAISAIPDETQRKIAAARWEFATKVNRNDGLTIALAMSLGLTDAQIDQAFIEASQL